MRLRDIGEIIVGPNPSRLRKVKEPFLYTVQDMEDDLGQVKGSYILSKAPDIPGMFTNSGDLVISLMKQQAAVVGHDRANKLLNANFIKYAYDCTIADPWYICYWLNEAEEVRRQRCRRMDLKSYTARFIGSIDIYLPTLEKQQEIGLIYKTMKYMQYLLEQQKQNWQAFTLQSIKNVLKEEQHNGRK